MNATSTTQTQSTDPICDACEHETDEIREHNGAKFCADCYDDMVWEAKDRIAQDQPERERV